MIPDEDQSQLNQQKQLLLVEKIERIKPYLTILWKNRWRIIIVNFILAIIVVASLYIFAKPYYDSYIVIFPDMSNTSPLSGLSDLASIAGVSVGLKPTDVYAELITSETIMTEVIYRKYLTEEFKDSVNLIQYFEIDPKESDPISVRERRRFLFLYKIFVKSRIRATINNQTGILELKVTMPESKLSSDVANQIVVSLNSYMQTKRKSQAKNQRLYIEKRISQVSDSLIIAEENLKNFQAQNRVMGQSPELLLEQNRLQRSRQILEAVYLQLSQQLELVKIEEVKDLPIINLKEYAQEPVVKTGPVRFILFIFIMLIIFGTNISYVIFKKQVSGYLKLIKTKLLST